MGAGLALSDVPGNQLACLFGQLPIPAGQQLPQHRAGLSSGKRDVQCAESLLQSASGACGQVMCPALGQAERDGQIVVVKVVPED